MLVAVPLEREEPYEPGPVVRISTAAEVAEVGEVAVVRRPASLLRRASVLAGSRPMLVVAGERDLPLRTSRLRAVAADRVAQRRRPTRPTMRALVLLRPGRLAWRDVPVPAEPGPGAAVVRPIAMATCDLDRPLALGHTAFPTPLQLGHECVAEVVSVGEGVRGSAVGDRVVVPFQISCGRCPACARGRSGSCRSVPPLSMYGFGVAGGAWGGVLADLVAVPFADAMLVPLPSGVDPASAASSADTLSDAFRHVAPHLDVVRGHPDGPRVIAVGAVDASSPFGASVPLFVGLIVRALLPGSEFLLVDERPSVRELAGRLGLAAAPARKLRGVRAPLVVDCSASRRGLRLALTAVADDGVCSCAGTLHTSVPIPASLMFGRNVTLGIARSHVRQVVPRVLDLLAAGRVDAGRVITQRGSFDDAVDVLDAHPRGHDVTTVHPRD